MYIYVYVFFFSVCRIWALTFSRPVPLLTILTVELCPLEHVLNQLVLTWRDICLGLWSVSNFFFVPSRDEPEMRTTVLVTNYKFC